MYVFQPYIHRPDSYSKLFEARQEVEKVVRSESELDGLDTLGGEIQIR
jgi:hypothetical protein